MNQTITIGGKKIGAGQRVFVIAEAGVNHNQDLSLAIKLIDAAADAGADAIKFQTFVPEDIVTERAAMAGYQARNIGKRTSQIDMLRALTLPDSFYPTLLAHCKKRKIMFLSTPHSGPKSVDFLKRLGVAAYKFGSGDLTNLPVLAHAARIGKPLIISTGMATMAEIKEALDCIARAGNKNVVVLQCTTDYPLAHEEVNLRAMEAIGKKLRVPVGYSDHTTDAQAAVMAVTRGAVMIEKHITTSRALPGPDHAASAEPDMFKDYVRQIRLVPTILGDGIKRPMKSEKQYIAIVRKSIVTTRAIKRGEKLSATNIAIKRPEGGLHPRQWWKVVTKKAARDLPADSFLTAKDIS